MSSPKSPSPASPFWKTVPLHRMTRDQWESLCDGCGRCCLQKFQDGKTGKVTYTWVSCYLLDTQTCHCTHYLNRAERVPDCLHLTPELVPRLRWLPTTCAYRRIFEGKDLEPWHPLVSGDPESVHKAGISIRNKAMPETCVHPDDVMFYAIGHRF
ncbi:YcgN family cysteine cluster protein [Desulfosarcina sp. OttesenSCG-928-G10]|nr:YcgN family cysteine cluster protein [Desulfosarcina sp. OttesenSCG-928-G10]MDL2321432.1 YcgN family cysteine cluster protein [Desulfosarcina sp. OttesenSCG-928-B08]